MTLALVIIACKEKPSDQQEETAQRSDTLITRSDSTPVPIDYTTQNIRLRATLAQGTCTDWKLRGDSLHEALLLATARLERMRNTMESRPLDDLRVADSLYLADSDGEQLYRDLRSFYRMALRSAANKEALKRTEGLSAQVLRFSTAEAWRKQCFTQVARVTTSAILSKISTDVFLLENICLHSILKECEHSVGGSPFPENDSVEQP